MIKYILINRSEHITSIAKYYLKDKKETFETGVRITHQNMTLKEMNGSIIQAHFENGVKKCCDFKVGNWKSMMEKFDSLVKRFRSKTNNTATKTDIPVTTDGNEINMSPTSSIDNTTPLSVTYAKCDLANLGYLLFKGIGTRLVTRKFINLNKKERFVNFDLYGSRTMKPKSCRKNINE